MCEDHKGHAGGSSTLLRFQAKCSLPMHTNPIPSIHCLDQVSYLVPQHPIPIPSTMISAPASCPIPKTLLNVELYPLSQYSTQDPITGPSTLPMFPASDPWFQYPSSNLSTSTKLKSPRIPFMVQPVSGYFTQ